MLLLLLLLSVACTRAASHNETRQWTWSTFRPNLYFGLKPSLPRSLSTGIIWHGVQSYKALNDIRHTCEQHDGVGSYNWIRHDGRTAGQQVIRDDANNIELKTSFLKLEGGPHGGHWGVRLEGTPIASDQPSKISLIHYLALEGDGKLELDDDDADEDGIKGAIEVTGSTPDLGKFSVKILDAETSEAPTGLKHQEDFGDRLNRFQYTGLEIAPDQTWRAKEALEQQSKQSANQAILKHGQHDPPDPALLFLLDNQVRAKSNLVAVQRILQGPFTVDVLYTDTAYPNPLDSKALSAGLVAFERAYDARFDQIFQLGSKKYPASDVAFARTMTASMLGGIGYFFGRSVVDSKFMYEHDAEEAIIDSAANAPAPVYTEERSLLTATPSRPFFPRGFYWDEGFHLLLIGLVDPKLSLEILQSWMNSIDEHGWIAREQILGDEARSKVPKEFWTQYPTYGNPPTLPLAVSNLLDQLDQLPADELDEPRASILHSLQLMYPNLKRHFEWFLKTQRGSSIHGRHTTYRWRGRTEDHVLTSGLDDYPRAKPASSGELHVDLASWMAFFMRTMQGVATKLGIEDDAADYEDLYETTWQNIEKVHWNEDLKMYCDVSVDENDEAFHVCHKGYVTLLPLLLSLVPPTSDRLEHLLSDLRNPSEVWSNWGILSLSRQDVHFGTGEDYWRGSIWIQMNYLALQALYSVYANTPGPQQVKAAEIYAELRENVVSNIASEFRRTGFVWEQYNAKTGAGQRSRPFTGWTALVVNIMAEMY